MSRMQELVDKLNHYAYTYYVLDNPVISDVQYDNMYDELVLLEKNQNVVLPDSPTRKVGGEPIKGFNQHAHVNKLYSLDKCNTYDELKEWAEKINKSAGCEVEYSIEYKLDGLTLCLTYNNGYFVRATTRGNGEIGEDVTSQVQTINSIPLKIDYSGTVEVQGEGIMRWSAFNKYNEKAVEPLKNPRNGVAGAIRNLDPKITRTRNLDIIFYNLNYIDNGKAMGQSEAIEFLKKNRFKTEKLFISNNIDEIVNQIESVSREQLDYCIDGMVVKVNNAALREKLGFTDKFPRWAIAFKFEAEETTTILRDVVWQVGRTGKLTPLALLEPVELGGATISKATLNNANDIERKKVKIGSSVFLRRSNDVIPEILGIAETLEGRDIEIPKKCPSCGSELTEIGAHIFCSNSEDCPPQVCGRIEHFVSKDCMDIDGISEKTVVQLYEKLGVRSIVELYEIKAEDLIGIDKFKKKKIDNFIASMGSSKKADLPHFINALGIPNIGKKSARDLAVKFSSIEALSMATLEELTSIDEFGDIMAESVVNYFSKSMPVIIKFIELGINPQFKEVSSASNFSGKRVVITGSLSIPRSQISMMVEERGGIIQSAVTSDTDYVIVGEAAGSKLGKAKKLGKKILNENDFNSLLNA